MAWLPPVFADSYLTVPIASYHFDRDKDYNETNLGIGYEKVLNERWRVGGGFFRNSNRDDSVFMGATYTRWHWRGLKFGGVVGFVTGYEPRPIFLAAPVMMVETKDFGINVIFIPPANDKPGALGFQLKFGFQ